MNPIEIPFPELEPSVFTWNSLPGIFILIAGFFIIKYSSERIVDVVFKLAGFIIIWQILYVVGCSSLDSVTHFSMIFHYDIFSSIAQLFPGTFIAKGLTWMGYYLSQFIADIINWVFSFGVL